MPAIYSFPNGPEFRAALLLKPNKSNPVVYCRIMSRLTKLVQSKEDRNNFFKFNILLKKRISMTKINTRNLKRNRDLKIGLFSNGQICNISFNNPGLRN